MVAHDFQKKYNKIGDSEVDSSIMNIIEDF